MKDRERQEQRQREREMKREMKAIEKRDSNGRNKKESARKRDGRGTFGINGKQAKYSTKRKSLCGWVCMREREGERKRQNGSICS